MLQKIRKFLDRLTFLRSLRVIFFIFIFLVGVIPCILLQNGILESYEQRAVEVREEQVKGQLRSVANHLISSNYLVNQDSGQVDAQLSEFSTLYDGRLLIIDTTLTVVKDTYGISENKTIVSQDVISCLQTGDRAGLQNYDEKYGYLEVVIPIIETRTTEERDSSVRLDEDGVEEEDGLVEEDETGLSHTVIKPEPGHPENSANNGVRGVLLASTSTEYIQKTKEILRRKAWSLQMVMLVVIFIACVLISGFLVKPFEKLSIDIREVKEGYSNEPIQAPMYTETRHIADAFNNVLGRMNALDQSRQEFVANVSHELKTPMTSMKVLAASLLSEENVDPAMYREFLEDINNEIDRENKIISDLLALVREDRTDIDLAVSSTDINELAENVLRRLSPIAQLRDIELTLVHKNEVIAEVDETQINLVLTNLVENAIKYNRQHGEVSVTVDADHEYFQFTVHDNGIGIPEEEQSRIFERFYRVDKSRSRAIGGTGLGLSITKSAVIRHHGTITLTSKEGEGTTFVVRIPLRYSSQPMELHVGSQHRQISRFLNWRRSRASQKKYMEKTVRVSRRKFLPDGKKDTDTETEENNTVPVKNEYGEFRVEDAEFYAGGPDSPETEKAAEDTEGSPAEKTAEETGGWPAERTAEDAGGSPETEKTVEETEDSSAEKTTDLRQERSADETAKDFAGNAGLTEKEGQL